MRALFIMLGLALLQHFHWMTYVFGLILILTALRLLRKPSEEVEIERNLVMRVARRFLRLTPVYHGGRFFFVGVKMLLASVYKISPGASLGFIASILLMSVVLSLLVGSKETPNEENGDR